MKPDYFALNIDNATYVYMSPQQWAVFPISNVDVDPDYN